MTKILLENLASSDLYHYSDSLPMIYPKGKRVAPRHGHRGLSAPKKPSLQKPPTEKPFARQTDSQAIRAHAFLSA